MHDSVQWLIRSSQKDTESPVFSNLPTKIGEEPKCDTCDYTLDIDFIPRVYLFDDGRQLNMLQRHVWCTQCDCVTVAESLVESPARQTWFRDRYQNQCERLANADLIDLGQKELVQKSIAAMDMYQQLLNEWQIIRKRQPFCLRCCNTRVVVPESEFSDLPHPTCGGQLKCTGSAQGGTYIGPEPHKYNIDGELIELGYNYGLSDGSKQSTLDLWWPIKT